MLKYVGTLEQLEEYGFEQITNGSYKNNFGLFITDNIINGGLDSLYDNDFDPLYDLIKNELIKKI